MSTSATVPAPLLFPIDPKLDFLLDDYNMRRTKLRKGQLMTAAACLECRKRKTKCSGERPACASCVLRGKKCAYDVESGLTRLQDLRLQLRRKDEELARMENLIQTLIRGPEADATELLARLRSSGYFEVPELRESCDTALSIIRRSEKAQVDNGSQARHQGFAESDSANQWFHRGSERVEEDHVDGLKTSVFKNHGEGSRRGHANRKRCLGIQPYMDYTFPRRNCSDFVVPPGEKGDTELISEKTSTDHAEVQSRTSFTECNAFQPVSLPVIAGVQSTSPYYASIDNNGRIPDGVTCTPWTETKDHMVPVFQNLIPGVYQATSSIAFLSSEKSPAEYSSTDFKFNHADVDFYVGTTSHCV